jgi:hypothetical protein
VPVLAAWGSTFALAWATSRWPLAVDTGTAAIASSAFSLVAAITVAFLNGRRRMGPDALVEALVETQERAREAQERADAAEVERDEARAALEQERVARLSDLRALAEARGLRPGDRTLKAPRHRP